MQGRGFFFQRGMVQPRCQLFATCFGIMTVRCWICLSEKGRKIKERITCNRIILHVQLLKYSNQCYRITYICCFLDQADCVIRHDQSYKEVFYFKKTKQTNKKTLHLQNNSASKQGSFHRIALCLSRHQAVSLHHLQTKVTVTAPTAAIDSHCARPQSAGLSLRGTWERVGEQSNPSCTARSRIPARVPSEAPPLTGPSHTPVESKIPTGDHGTCHRS